MAETRRIPPHATVEQGLIASLFTFVAKGIHWALLALIVAILLEWAGMIWWWPAEGVQHSRRMLEVEQGYLGTAFRRHLFTVEPVRLAATIGNQLSYVIFELSRLNDVIKWATTAPAADEARIRVIIRRFMNTLTRYLIAAEQILRVFGTRLAILILAIPIFGLGSIVAIIDGLVRRDLRRWGGGRESGFIYHWAKRVALPLAVGVWLVYLVLPFSLHPVMVILLLAVLLSIALTTAVGTFKKYL
jgi:integrating conjugative element membrane protein (TIGR03747 family)